MLLFFILCPIFGLSALTEIRVGGLFTPVSKDNQFSLVQAEHLAAFVMAIREINNKTDGQWDDLLPNTVLKYDIITDAIGYQAASLALVQLESSFSDGLGVEGIIGALPDVETMAINAMTGEHAIPMVHSVATSTELGQGGIYPYKSQTIPINSFRSMVFQSLICGINVQKVVIITTTDVSGVRASQELQDGVYCPITVLGIIDIRTHDFDMGYVIEQAEELGGRVYALYTPPEYTAAILEQGYADGLFKQDTIFFSLDNDIIPHFSPDTDVAAVMTGYFGVEYWPKYTFGRTPMAIDFARRWSAQASTAGVGGSCDVTKDDEGSTFLYRSQTNASLCTGLDFSSYPVDGSTIADDTALTYEATLVLAHALHAVIEAGQDYSNGKLLQNAIINNVTFEGITGNVDMYEGMAEFDFYAKGDREVGLVFKVVNFQAWAYEAGIHPFIQVNAWSSDEGSLIGCTFSGCANSIFKTSGSDKSLPPSDTFPDIIVSMAMPLRGLLLFCSIVTFLVMAFYAIFTWKFSKSKPVKASQPVMLYATIVGGLLAAARVFIAAVQQSDVTCELQTWFGHLAFCLVFGSLFVKTYRVHKLVNNQSIKRVKFSSKRALMILAGIVFAFVLMLATISFEGMPHLGYIISLESNQYTKVEICKMANPEVQTVMFSLEFVMILVGLRLCYLIRNVYDSVNESNIVAAALIFILLVSCLVLVIRMPPATNSLIASIVFAVGAISVLSVLFIPKMFAVRALYIAAHAPISKKVKEALSSKKKAKLDAVANGAECAAAVVGAGRVQFDLGVAHDDEHHDDDDHDDEEDGPLMATKSVLKSMSIPDRVRFCNEQIHKWQCLQTTCINGAVRSDNSSTSVTFNNEASATPVALKLDEMKSRGMLTNLSGTLQNLSLKLSRKKGSKPVIPVDNDDEEHGAQAPPDVEQGRVRQASGFANDYLVVPGLYDLQPPVDSSCSDVMNVGVKGAWLSPPSKDLKGPDKI